MTPKFFRRYLIWTLRYRLLQDSQQVYAEPVQAVMQILLVLSIIFSVGASANADEAPVGEAAKILMASAIKEFCDDKNPEYKLQNDQAFNKWQSRNSAAIAQVEAHKEDAHHKEAMRQLMTFNVRSDESSQVCAGLAARLDNLEFDVPRGVAIPGKYSAKSIEAWVVDADTNKPIEGVIVVANWEILAGEMQASSKIIQLKILETVTDKNGRFYFPFWGPEPNPSLIGYIGSNDPGLTFFKSGYKYQALDNEVGVSFRFDALRYSDWDGKTIKIKKIGSDPKELLRDFENLNFIVEIVVRDTKACDWKKIPKMLLAVRKQRTLLIEKGITGGILGIHSVDEYLISNAEKFSREGGPTCGSPKNFFESN